MRTLALIVVLVGASCDRDPRASSEGPVITSHEVPSWAALPPPSPIEAKPQPWKPDGRPTLMLFSAAWCASCRASLLADVAIVQTYGDRFQVGVALVENTDADFAGTWMARLLAGVPVWSAASVRDFATRCGAASIPLACIVDRGRVVFRGSADRATRMLDAYRGGTFDATLAADAAAQAAVVARFALGVDSADIADIVKATKVDHGWQNSIAWQLASNREATATDVALAVSLAQDAVAADGGLDFSHLDTYSLALSKAGLAGQAATVSWRILALCATVHAECMVERRRAYAYIYYARERGFQSRR